MHVKIPQHRVLFHIPTSLLTALDFAVAMHNAISPVLKLINSLPPLRSVIGIFCLSKPFYSSPFLNESFYITAISIVIFNVIGEDTSWALTSSPWIRAGGETHSALINPCHSQRKSYPRHPMTRREKEKKRNRWKDITNSKCKNHTLMFCHSF